MRFKHLLYMALSLLVLSGCASTPMVAEEAPPANANTVEIPIYFGTDRLLTGELAPAEKCGSERGETLNTGIAVVSMPRVKSSFEPESPSAWKLIYREKPPKEGVLEDTTFVEKDRFDETLRARVKKTKSKNILFFIHGYNVSFEDAARTAAQLGYGVGFEGTIALYSWPSKGELLEYFADEATIEWSLPNVKAFLLDLLTNSGAENIYFVAHSMGNRGMLRGLLEILAERPKLKGKVGEIILAAPDVDAGVFRRDLAPGLAKFGRPITLYASTKDNALALSQKIHSFPRAGEAGKGIVVVPGVETVDVTAASTGFLNHSYITEEAAVIADIRDLIKNGLHASERSGLTKAVSPAGSYWKFGK